MTRYMLEKKKRDEENDIRNQSLFGIIGGLLCFIIGGLNYLSFDGIAGFLSMIQTSIGIIFFILGIVAPQLLKGVYSVLSAVGNKVGELFFAIMLVILYILMVIPIGYIWRKDRRQFGWVIWKDLFSDNDEVPSGFTKYNMETISKHDGMIGTAIGVIGFIISNGKTILLPIVIILILLGVVLFFVSSSIIAPFIYTLF